jgi:DNA-binding transcriptional LysR family regulator
MDVKLLEAFRCVVDHRSVTAAANALGVTQPAVSTQIARLEEAIGFPLFERSGRRLAPTPEGLLFYTEAARVLGEFDRLQAATEQIRAGQLGRLTVASHPWAATALLPGVVARFLDSRPGVELRLISRHSDVVSQLLPTESFEIGIAEMPIDPSAIDLTRYTMRCVAILPPGHPLAAREVLVPSDLSGLPMVAAARSLQMHGRVAGAFAAAGLPVKISVEAELFASVCAMVAAGVGWSIVDPLSAQRFAHLGIVLRPFAPAIQYDIGVFHRRDREPSVLAAAFLALLAAELTP